MQEGGYPSNFLYYLQMSCSGNGRASRILSEYKRIPIQKYLQNSDSEKACFFKINFPVELDHSENTFLGQICFKGDFAR